MNTVNTAVVRVDVVGVKGDLFVAQYISSTVLQMYNNTSVRQTKA